MVRAVERNIRLEMWFSPRLLGVLVLTKVLPTKGLSTPKDGIVIPNNASLNELIENDPASLVNLFIGTTNGGHSFPGATLPHGMIKVGLDTDSPGNVSTSIHFSTSRRISRALKHATSFFSLSHSGGC